jgi:hypothetical protein
VNTVINLSPLAVYRAIALSSAVPEGTPCDFGGVNARTHGSTSLEIVELKLDGYLKTRIDYKDTMELLIQTFLYPRNKLNILTSYS